MASYGTEIWSSGHVRRRARPCAPPSLGCYQPAFERDGVHVELLHQAQVVVHVLQAAQHLRPQRKEAVNVSQRAGRNGVSADLVVFPVPDVECRLFEGLHRLLRQRVLQEGNRQSTIRQPPLLHGIPPEGGPGGYLWVIWDIPSWGDLLPII